MNHHKPKLKHITDHDIENAIITARLAFGDGEPTIRFWTEVCAELLHHRDQNRWRNARQEQPEYNTFVIVAWEDGNYTFGQYREDGWQIDDRMAYLYYGDPDRWRPMFDMPGDGG